MPFNPINPNRLVEIQHQDADGLFFRQVSGAEYAEFLAGRDDADDLDVNVWMLSKAIVEANGSPTFASYEAAKEHFDAAPFTQLAQFSRMYLESGNAEVDFVSSPLSD